MPKIIQVSVTDAEYNELTLKAEEHGLSIPRYLVSQGLPDNDFQKWFPELVARVSAIQGGTSFNVREVFGVDWKRIPKGIRLALGRVFYQQVSTGGKIPNVKATGADGAKVQWYYKDI